MSTSEKFAWSSRPYGRVFNNLTIVNTPQGREELAEITGDALMEAAAAAGAKTAIFDSRNQWYCFHPSRTSIKHPGLGDRDLTAEILAAGNRLGIEYVPYIPVDCDRRAFDEHPEWRNVNAAGQVVDQNFPRVCEASPFKDFIADYIRDLLTDYPINGLWFDGLGVHESCYCSYCRDGFAAKTGHAAPESEVTDPATWKLWIDYKHELSVCVFRTLAAVAESVRPGIPIHTAWESGIRESAQSWVEAYWKWPTPFLQTMRNDTGKTAEFYVLTVQYAPSYPITLNTQELRDRAMSALANGAIPTFTLTGIAEGMRAVSAEIEARAPWFGNADPVPYVAVAHSERAKQLCEKDQHKDGPDFTIYGTVMALVEEKIPETCLSDHNMDHDDLTKYAVVVLPDVGIIPDALADKLRAYVAQGGGLVASARTSLCADDGSELPDFRLADLLGVHYRGIMPDETNLPSWYAEHSDALLPNKSKCKYLTLSDHEIVADPLIRAAHSYEVVPAYRRGTPRGVGLAYPGPMLRVSAEAGVEAVLSEAFQDPGTEWPLITTHTYGKGRVAYIAANLGFHYASHWSYPFVRRMQANAVRWAAGDNLPPVQVESLLQVHPTVYRQREPDRLVVHLLNAPNAQGYPPNTRQSWGGYAAALDPNASDEALKDTYFKSFGRIREDLAPVHNIRLKLRGTFRRIYTAPGNVTLTPTIADGWSEVVVPSLDTHIMVVAE